MSDLGSTQHPGRCCSACLKVARALTAEGKSDPYYSGELRCCCRAEIRVEATR